MLELQNTIITYKANMSCLKTKILRHYGSWFFIGDTTNGKLMAYNR